MLCSLDTDDYPTFDYKYPVNDIYGSQVHVSVTSPSVTHSPRSCCWALPPCLSDNSIEVGKCILKAHPCR